LRIGPEEPRLLLGGKAFTRVRDIETQRVFVGAELEEGADLSGVCLDGIDLSKGFVVASFKRASLRRAVFREANVKTCDFSDADLRDADFSGAALCSTTFRGASLDGAHFGGASYHSRTLKEPERPDW
jgi:uncharacterized protein YjbI with pentapeptide repeats